MVLELPNHIAALADPDALRLDLAVGMYASNRLTLGQGAALASLSQFDFQRELGRRQIPAHYGVEDLAHDLANLPGLPPA